MEGSRGQGFKGSRGSLSIRTWSLVIFLTLWLYSGLARAANIENIPTDSWIYEDLDLLKVSGLIVSMPQTSRPWTRGEAAALVREADSLSNSVPLLPAQLGALERLRQEFGFELRQGPGKRPLVAIPVSEVKDGFVYGDLFSRLSAIQERSNDSLYFPVPYRMRQTGSLGAVIGNRPGDRFVFYERGEVTFYQPFQGDTWDSSGLHLPQARASAFHDLLAFEIEHAYLAFKVPWVRLEFGRDRLFWGPGYISSVLLADHAPSLDLGQIAAVFRNFKFIGFTSYLSRWNYIHRFLSAQRVEFSVLGRATLGMAMMNVYSWDSLLLAPIAGFANPLLPGYIEAANTHHTSNLLVGFDGVVYLPRTKVYAQVNFDNYEFNTLRKAPNAVAGQAGVRTVLAVPVDFLGEYSRIAAFTYYHRIHHIMFENWQVPLGHRLGPDADQLYLRVRYLPSRSLKLGLWADYTRRGYYNRGDFLRKSFFEHEPLPEEFPARGRDSLGNIIATDDVDRTGRIGPELEWWPVAGLRVVARANLWAAQNFNGTPGLSKNGREFALKLEYRY